jgi:hypothetical protein
MVEQTREMNATHALGAWGLPLQAGVCERCDWTYIFASGEAPDHCPQCFQAPLEILDPAAHPLPGLHAPELSLAFTITGEAIAQSIIAFAGRIPFAPLDLQLENLAGRLQKIYLPMWLVDVQVETTWQAEVGHDYEVVSHQERFSDHQGWATREVNETRVRWEPRLGNLNRRYDNLPAPALEENRQLSEQMGDFQVENPLPYDSALLKDAVVRLPDRPPGDAWGAAVPGLQAAAAEEVRRAAGADHVRQFRWDLGDPDRTWTMMLLPVYSTYYQDDEGRPQPILLHGQSGRISGPRRASMQRARRTAGWILAAAGVLLLISLVLSGAGILLPALLPIGAAGLFLTVLVGLGASVPVLRAWAFNRAQQKGTGGSGP